MNAFFTKDGETLPKIFKVIEDYFMEDQSRLNNSHLFAKLSHEQMKLVDTLEQHLAFGDYNFLMNIDDPSIIGCYFKSVLKYMEEPLCTFEKYSNFKELC